VIRTTCAQNRALSRKVSDEFAVPLCRGHQGELRRSGDEPAWWRNAGVNPLVTARSLWLKKHPLSRKRTGNGASSAADAARTDPKDAARITKRSQLKGRARMTSFRQIEANRRNSRKSPGPTTEEGKRRSRCNADQLLFALDQLDRRKP
jgi:hypothetical protein